MQLIDTHAHLDDPQLYGHVGRVVAAARDSGVINVIAVGCSAASSAACIEIAQQYEGVFAAVGIQPNDTIEARDGDWQQIVELAKNERVRAIGETGIDCYWDRSPLPLQRDYFARHVQLSQQTGLPFIVHMRESGDEILQVLRELAAHGPLRGVMHSFTGDQRLAEQCLELGLYISFAGMVTFKKSDELRTVAAGIPADRLLIETDSPYLTPHPKRGVRPNTPAMVRYTAECLAECRGVKAAELARQTTANARELFRLP